MKDLGAGVLDKSAQMISNIQKDLADVVKEQDALIQESESESLRQKNALLPWEGLKTIKSNSNGNMTSAVKEEILELSQSQDFFLIDEENYMYHFDFDLNQYKYQAIKVLEFDRNLDFIRSKLVPKKISDEKFWKNYFYNVEIIKMKYNMANQINQSEKLESAVVVTIPDLNKKSNLQPNQDVTETKEVEKRVSHEHLSSQQKQDVPTHHHHHHHQQHHHVEEQEIVFNNDEDDFNSSQKKSKVNQFLSEHDEIDDLDIEGIQLGEKNQTTLEMTNL